VRLVSVVLPGDIDDPTNPSGGNRYDRRVCDGLGAAGWSVREVVVAGSWPHPTPADRARLAGALAAVPDGMAVLLDGLVACAAPDVLVPESGRLRLVVLVHLPLGDETGAAADLDARERETLHAAAAVVATSAATGRRLVEHHDLPAAKVSVARPGVDPAPPHTGEAGGRHLLSVAAVTPRKGHDVLVEALATIADHPWQCVIAGALDRAPEHVAGLRRLIDTHRLGDRIRLVGPRSGAELDATYAAAELMVLASRAEPYGMVVTEALARGIPVVATAVDGLSEALGRAPDGSVPGLLVPAENPPALADAVRRWLTEPATRDRLRASARARRGNLDRWPVTVEHLARALEGVTA
jgi:glycosyltransferase involved in cell wall biosynthesis